MGVMTRKSAFGSLRRLPSGVPALGRSEPLGSSSAWAASRMTR
jgi:hypothetical protein